MHHSGHDNRERNASKARTSPRPSTTPAAAATVCHGVQSADGVNTDGNCGGGLPAMAAWRMTSIAVPNIAKPATLRAEEHRLQRNNL
ncbi:MAG: hypothetical protein QM775_23320 [Pirellulales bacterium]